MSLLDETAEPCTMLDKTTVRDGYGGFTYRYVEGAGFDANFSLDTSTPARVAEKQGVKNLFTVTTKKSITLMHGDVFRRESDGKTFRVTSDGADKKTPESATLNMRVVSAEEWSLPNGQDTGD